MSVETQIQELLDLTGLPDPKLAVIQKARDLIASYHGVIEESQVPLNLEMVASTRGIALSKELPVGSDDAELVPDGTGGVVMRVNPDRPETRRRFSMAHEIAHTFFSGYKTRVHCRNPKRAGVWTAEDQIESLCDIGAAELLFPEPWFSTAARSAGTASDLVDLAERFSASRDATLRRFAECASEPLVAVFFSWRLKPTQRSLEAHRGPDLFGRDPAEVALAARRLRVSYAIPSPSFGSSGLFVPKDKSISEPSPILESARSRGCLDTDCFLDLGTLRGQVHANIVPVFVPPEELGPNAEGGVAAIIRPREIEPESRRGPGDVSHPRLFH